MNTPVHFIRQAGPLMQNPEKPTPNRPNISMAKVQKITSYFYDKRKILSQKFLSHETFLGSMGPESQQDADEIFSKSQILVIWGPHNCPVIVACREQAEKLNLASSLV